MNEKLIYTVFEVFVQRSHTDSHVHVGSLVAPSAGIALQTARENFARREVVINIWVVPKGEIKATAYETDFFSREMDRSYREVSGYTENGRLWRMFKEKVLTLEEMVRFVEDQKAEKQEV